MATTVFPPLHRGGNTVIFKTNNHMDFFSHIYTVFFLSTLLSITSAYSQGWQRTGVDYHAVQMPGNGRIVFVGDYGGILLSEDGGDSWSLPQSGTWSHLRALQFRDAMNGIAAGDKGTLLQTTDGGRTWAALPSPIQSSIHVLDFPSTTVGYGLADAGVMLKTTNGGQRWDTLTSRLPDHGTDMDFSNEQIGIAVTASGQIYRTTNGGAEWRVAFTDSSLTFSGVAFASYGTIGYACSREREILKTTDAGQSWVPVTPVEPGLSPLCVAVSDSGNIYIGGERLIDNPNPYNAMDWSDDGGQSWKRPSLRITGWEDLAMEDIALDGEELALAGNNGTALMASKEFERADQHVISNSLLRNSVTGLALPLYKVAFSGADTGIATVNFRSTTFGTIHMQTTDGGISWRYSSTTTVQDYLDIFGFPGGEFLTFSSNGGGLHRTTNAGRTWLSRGIAPVEPRINEFRAGTMLDSERGYKTGDSLVYQTTDSGRTWQPKFFSEISNRWSGFSVVMSLSFPTFETGYAAMYTLEGRQVFVVRTTDAGETWQEVLHTKGSLAYYDLHFVNEEKGFYCEGRFGDLTSTLYSTTNGGESWDSLVFDDVSPIAVKFFDEMNGFLLGSPQLLMRTTDGGKTWNREYPWPQEVDSSGTPFTDIVLLPDERTVILIGNGVLARKTYPEKLLSVSDERKGERAVGLLTVVPNPAHNQVRVVWSSDRSYAGTSVRLFNLQGRDMFGHSVPLGSSGIVELNVSGLLAGTYQAVIEDKDGTILQTASVVVVR